MYFSTPHGKHRTEDRRNTGGRQAEYTARHRAVPMPSKKCLEALCKPLRRSFAISIVDLGLKLLLPPPPSSSLLLLLLLLLLHLPLQICSPEPSSSSRLNLQVPLVVLRFGGSVLSHSYRNLQKSIEIYRNL